MEIISFLQGKKAQKKGKELRSIIGQGEFKSGDKDVIDTFDNADLRLKELEGKVSTNVLNTKVDELSSQTFVNLNKHNLYISSMLNAQRYEHKNMVMDDLKTLEGVQTEKLGNAKHDATKGIIQSVNPTNASEVVFKKEAASSLFYITAATAHNDTNAYDISFDIGKIESLENAEIAGTNIAIKKEDESNGIYFEKGAVVFSPVEINKSATFIEGKYNGNAMNKDVMHYYRQAENVEELKKKNFVSLSGGETLKGVVQFKIELAATKGEKQRLYEADLKNLTNSTYLEDRETGVGIKKQYEYEMSKDTSWTSEGSLHRKKIARDEWVGINKMNVLIKD